MEHHSFIPDFLSISTGQALSPGSRGCDNHKCPAFWRGGWDWYLDCSQAALIQMEGSVCQVHKGMLLLECGQTQLCSNQALRRTRDSTGLACSRVLFYIIMRELPHSSKHLSEHTHIFSGTKYTNKPTKPFVFSYNRRAKTNGNI